MKTLRRTAAALSRTARAGRVQRTDPAADSVPAAIEPADPVEPTAPAALVLEIGSQRAPGLLVPRQRARL